MKVYKDGIFVLVEDAGSIVELFRAATFTPRIGDGIIVVYDTSMNYGMNLELPIEDNVSNTYSTIQDAIVYLKSLSVAGNASTPSLPAGSNRELQYNNSGAFAGTQNALTHDGSIMLPDTPERTTPPDGVKLNATKLANKFFAILKDPNAIESFVQASFFQTNVQIYKAAGSVNQLNVLGGVQLTGTGTLTGSTISVTNIYTRSRIVEWLVTKAGTTVVAGFRNNNPFLFRDGGFFVVFRWAPSTGVATATTRASVGLHANQSAPTDINPSTIINHISMGWDSGDTNIQVMCNQGTGTSTKVDLGALFPRPNADRTKVYQMAIYCPAGNADVYYSVQDIGTGSVVTGTLVGGVDRLPASNVLLGLKGQMSVGGTSSVIGIGIHTIYVETTY